jgi:hypothetical protein
MEDNKDIQQDGEVEEVAKTYTEQELQEKVQSSFNAGVKKASTEWQKDEKYKEFLAWKKSSQNDTDKINELSNTNAELTNQNNILSKEIEKLNAQIKVDNSDVKKEFSRFVTSEVLGMVNETTDFDRALKEFKKNNPQYFGETVIKKIQTAPNLSGGSSTPLTTNSIMNSIIRGARE